MHIKKTNIISRLKYLHQEIKNKTYLELDQTYKFIRSKIYIWKKKVVNRNCPISSWIMKFPDKHLKASMIMANLRQPWNQHKATKLRLTPSLETGMTLILIEDFTIINSDLANTIFRNLYLLIKSTFHLWRILLGTRLVYQNMQITDITQRTTLNSSADQVHRQQNTNHHTRVRNHWIQDLPSVNSKDSTNQVVWLSCRHNCKLKVLLLFYNPILNFHIIFLDQLVIPKLKTNWAFRRMIWWDWVKDTRIRWIKRMKRHQGLECIPTSLPIQSKKCPNLHEVWKDSQNMDLARVENKLISFRSMDKKECF